MAIKKIKKTSVLDLEVKGSVGSFSVRGTSAKPSIRVRFLQTHVHLATDGNHDEKLLKALKPVREVFKPETLSFEQIMQRDIDDARVSTRLIPYLLDAAKTGTVKLFPPIVVVVLPLTNENTPADYYAPVDEFDEQDDELDANVHIVRSGQVGSEIFELRQVVEDGVAWEHDYAVLRLNTSKVALVIVDGQHRAMGLIALYRNIKGWPADVQRIAPYYDIWSKDVLAKYDMTDAKLPVMFCVFPDIDGPKPDLPRVHEACRAVFLALNKNARPVTRARNALLDDGDIIAAFMRDTLSLIKNSQGASSETRIRLWSVELDADEDKTVLTSPAAVTGVMHLFGLIERLMFASPSPGALSARKQNFWKSTRLDTLFERLQVRNKVSAQVQLAARRKSVRTDHSEVALLLTEAFRERFGDNIVRGLDQFAPYKANHDAALEHSQSLKGAHAEFYRAILYEGQSQAYTFRAFATGLTKEFKDELPYVPGPEFDKVQKDFKDRQTYLDTEIDLLKTKRREAWAGKRGSHASVQVRGALDKIYEESLITAAFQSAFFLTFFAAVQHVDGKRSKTVPPTAPLTDDAVHDLFSQYLDDINKFFAISTWEKLRKIVEVFIGKVDGDEASAQVIPAKHCLRRILIPGELKPDEWAKFRVLLVELWKPKSEAVPELGVHVKEVRKSLRAHALLNFVERELKDREHELSVARGKLPAAVRQKVVDECADHLAAGLAALGDGRVTGQGLKDLVVDQGAAMDEEDEGVEAEDP